MNNMAIYERVRKVPGEAMKPITAGRLKGMSDINPMWRIKTMTEVFGPCGIGWWYEITDKRIVEDETTRQKAAFVDVLVYYIDPESGKESHGIPGTGGASFVAQERNGAYLSDECYKMALTDALSVACKALGVAADVYFDKDRTKYNAQPDSTPQGPAMATEEQVVDIKRLAEDEQWAALQSKYGLKLERMSCTAAEKAIAKLEGKHE